MYISYITYLSFIVYSTSLVFSLLQLDNLHLFAVLLTLKKKKHICSNFQIPMSSVQKYDSVWHSYLFVFLNSSTNVICHKTNTTGSEAI